MRRLLALLVVALLVPASARAGALLRLTPTGWDPASYQAAGFPLDPAIIGANGFRLTFHGGGGSTLVNPVLLIIGVPTATTAPALSVSGSSGFNNVGVSVGGTNVYGGSWNTSTGAAGTFNSSATGSVYDFIGFTPQGSSSENYANWSGNTGLTSWNLFVYSLTFNPLMSSGSWVEFATSLPVGSYVVGYGCEQLKNGLCKTQGATQSTPFTFAGFVEVPEPTSLSFLVPGAALYLLRRRKLRA